MTLFRRRPARTGATGATIAEGWHGLRWGAPLSEFRTTFPSATLNESGWWRTGQGPEPFCGVEMAITQYAFNDHDELCTVAFIPETENRSRLPVAAINELGVPEGMDLCWTLGDVVAEIKMAGVVATLTHPTFADR